MALSMDEQRMLAEIERRLAAEDPALAARLSSFRRPGPAVRLRTTRAKIIGSLLTVALVVAISLTVYAMIPFRAHSSKTPGSRQASSHPAISAPARVGPPAAAGKSSATTKSSAVKSGTVKVTTTTKATAPKTASHLSASTHTASAHTTSTAS